MKQWWKSSWLWIPVVGAIIGGTVKGYGNWEYGRGVRDTESKCDSILGVDRVAYFESGRKAGYTIGWADCCFEFGLTQLDSICVGSDRKLVAYYRKALDKWQPPKDLHDLIGERMETTDGYQMLVIGANNLTGLVLVTNIDGEGEHAIKIKYLWPTTGRR